MGNLQHVVVGIKTGVVDSLLFLQDIVIKWRGDLGKLVVAGDPLLDELQEGEEDSGLYQDWKGVWSLMLSLITFLTVGWLVTYEQEVQQTVNEKHQNVQIDSFERMPGVETLNLVAGNVRSRNDLAISEGDVGPADGMLGRHWRVKCQILEIFWQTEWLCSPRLSIQHWTYCLLTRIIWGNWQDIDIISF